MPALIPQRYNPLNIRFYSQKRLIIKHIGFPRIFQKVVMISKGCSINHFELNEKNLLQLMENHLLTGYPFRI